MKKNLCFNIVNNVPYKKVQQLWITWTHGSHQAFDYKDVGLQIKVLPSYIYQDSNVYLDLELCKCV